MSRKIRTTQAADADISAAAYYIAQESRLTAERLVDELWERVELVAEFPELGRTPECREELRFIPISHRFKNYLIFYRLPSPEILEVVALIHGARDISTLLHKKRRGG